jgi:hypothetical protein
MTVQYKSYLFDYGILAVGLSGSLSFFLRGTILLAYGFFPNWDFPPSTVQLRENLTIDFDGPLVEYSPFTPATPVRILNVKLNKFPLFYLIAIIWSPWFDLGTGIIFVCLTGGSGARSAPFSVLMSLERKVRAARPKSTSM